MDEAGQLKNGNILQGLLGQEMLSKSSVITKKK